MFVSCGIQRPARSDIEGESVDSGLEIRRGRPGIPECKGQDAHAANRQCKLREWPGWKRGRGCQHMHSAAATDLIERIQARQLRPLRASSCRMLFDESQAETPRCGASRSKPTKAVACHALACRPTDHHHGKWGPTSAALRPERGENGVLPRALCLAAEFCNWSSRRRWH